MAELPPEELVGSALNRLETHLRGRDLHVGLPPDLPLVPCDAILLINLVENALKYGADPIEIGATGKPHEVVIQVSDRGPGIPPGEEIRIFDKFRRAGHEGTPGGVGLGLAICRAIALAHGGRIFARNRDGGGVSFFFLALPLDPACGSGCERE